MSSSMDNFTTRIFKTYFRYLEKLKLCVFLGWFIAVGVSAIFASRFQNATAFTMEPSPGSRTEIAMDIFNSDFSSISSEFVDAFLIQCDSCPNIGEDSFAESLFNQWRSNITSIFPNVFSNWESYWDFDSDLRPFLEQALISTDKKSTVVQFTTNMDLSADTRTLVQKELRRSSDFLNDNTDGYYIGVTGVDLILYDCRTSTLKAMLRNDIIVLPIALLILIWAIGSWRMLPVTIFCFISSLSLSLADLVFISYIFDTKVEIIVPSVMQGLTIAMNVDYSLFLFTRYIKERRRRPNVEAVFESLRTAGHVVLLSGLTLTLTFIGFTAFPVGFIWTMGLGCAMTLLSALLTNLTFIPACLLLFPNYFSVIQFLPLCSKREDLTREMAEEKSKFDSYSDPLLDARSIIGEADTELSSQPSCWYDITSILLRSKIMALCVIFVIFALTIPIAYFFMDLQISQSSWNILPSNAPSAEVYNVLKMNFPGGSTSPFYVVVEQTNQNATSVFNQPYFDLLNNMSSKLLKFEGLEEKSVTSLQRVNGYDLTANVALRLNETTKFYKYLWGRLVSNSRRSSVILVVTPFDPMLIEGKTFTHYLWDMIDELEGEINSDDFALYATGQTVSVTDVVDNTIDVFPVVFAAATALIFLLLAIAFRSAFLIIRYIFTLLVPIGFVLGWGVLVYEKGILNWTGISSLQVSNEKAIFWFSPILTIPVCVGLALDYDIFIFSRIIEKRDEGFSMKLAILNGVAETGGTISTAGVIMSIAFCGLLFTTVEALDECAVMFVASVLLDTFIVRTLLVPCFLYVFGDLNWWPTKKGEPIYTRSDRKTRFISIKAID